MKRSSIDAKYFARLNAEERAQYAQHVKDIMRQHKVPHRIRACWHERIKLATVRITGEHNVIPESDEPPF